MRRASRAARGRLPGEGSLAVARRLEDRVYDVLGVAGRASPGPAAHEHRADLATGVLRTHRQSTGSPVGEGPVGEGDPFGIRTVRTAVDEDPNLERVRLRWRGSVWNACPVD